MNIEITARHLSRLRRIYRSAGWPCHDTLEIELLAAGLLEQLRDDAGRETLRPTSAGIAAMAQAVQRHRNGRSAHERLVEEVALALHQQGRLVWTGLPLRAKVEEAWVQAIPDVFSMRNTTREAALEPVVHEIKVSRADLLADLKRPAKRAAYLGMARQVYYVLGCTAKGATIAEPEEIPPECGVMIAAKSGLSVVRAAPAQPFEALRFDVWMALAKAAPWRPVDGEPLQQAL